jgi:hypothetical protein
MTGRRILSIFRTHSTYVHVEEYERTHAFIYDDKKNDSRDQNNQKFPSNLQGTQQSTSLTFGAHSISQCECLLSFIYAPIFQWFVSIFIL